MGIFDSLFKDKPIHVYSGAGQMTDSAKRFLTTHPGSKTILDTVKKACDEYIHAMMQLKSANVGHPGYNKIYEHNCKLYSRSAEELCKQIIEAGAKMVVTDLATDRNLLVFTNEMVLFWNMSLFSESVFIHPAPYKEKFLSFIHTRGVNYFYYYCSPDGKYQVSFAEDFRRPMNQLHLASGIQFRGDRKEDHLLDAAVADVLGQIWKV